MYTDIVMHNLGTTEKNFALMLSSGYCHQLTLVVEIMPPCVQILGAKFPCITFIPGLMNIAALGSPTW